MFLTCEKDDVASSLIVVVHSQDGSVKLRECGTQGRHSECARRLRGPTAKNPCALACSDSTNKSPPPNPCESVEPIRGCGLAWQITWLDHTLITPLSCRQHARITPCAVGRRINRNFSISFHLLGLQKVFGPKRIFGPKRTGSKKTFLSKQLGVKK